MCCQSVKTVASILLIVVAIPCSAQQYNNGQQYINGQQYNNIPPYSAAQNQYTVPPNQQTVQNGINIVQPAAAVHWTQTLAPEKRTHDFGVVPSFSNQEFLFEFKNSFDYPLHLISVRASCGCTRPSILTSQVAPGETAQVLAKYDTRNFKGIKKATVSVSLRKDNPYTEYGEIQFQVKGNIRRDVVLNPGTVSFDDVTLGEAAKRSVQILYAGNPAWKITDIKSSNPNLKVAFEEIQRNAQTQRVDYNVTISLGEQRNIGPFKEQLVITTNDVSNKMLTVNVEGNIKAVVQVSPVRLGVVSKDQNISKKLIVRGDRPFGIKSVSCGDQRIQFSPSEGSKTLHILEYKLDTSNIGKIVSNITIETDDPDQRKTSVSFEAQIVPATFALEDNTSNKE